MGSGITLAPLTRLKIEHGYYGSHPPGIRLVPTPAARKALAGAGCRLRDRSDGVEIYAGAPVGDTPKRPSGPGMKLLFWLEVTDPHFWTVTQPDWTGDAVRNCFFLSEKTQQAKRIAATSATVLPVRSKSFRGTFDAALSGEALTLRDWRGGPPVWTGNLQRQGSKILDLPLHLLPDGRYSLQLDGAQLSEFYLTNRAVAGFWGAVEIDLGDAEPSLDGQEPLTYTITFSPRKSRWRYVIRSLTKGRDLSAAQINATPAAAEFNGATPDPAGRPDIWIIESENPLPLYASPAPHHSLILMLPSASGPAPPPVPLPCPSADATRLQPSGRSTEMWSTIYVTV